MSFTESHSYTYTTLDIERVVRRFTADIIMIAQSSGAITEAKAREYAHDVEALAKKGYLKKVDLTLLSSTTEIRATQYVVSTTAGDLTMSRPGGVLWPRVVNPDFRVVLRYTEEYTQPAREAMKNKLKITWVPSAADTSHSTLKAAGGRDYASNSWGMQQSQPIKSQPSNAMLNGLTNQLMPTVTAIPRHCSATRCSAPKSTFNNIGTIISQISTATGMLTSATVRRPRNWKGPGTSRPSTMPARMKSATQMVR